MLVGDPLAAVGVGNAAYSALTRYEGGFTEKLSMDEHLALDAAEGAGFCAAALLLDNECRDVRGFSLDTACLRLLPPY